MTRLSDAALQHLRALAAERPADPQRYTIVEEIGRGGMGTVYRAADRELGRDVALKALPAGLGDASDAATRMLREARTLARLEHPGIVPVHDVGTLADGRLFYTMKLVRGERLDAPTVRGGGLAERLRLFVRICDAVSFAHANGVIHRDLKPANVMVGAFGEVLVMDWGIAKLRDEASPARRHGAPAAAPARPDGADDTAPVTAPGTVLGTPGYMAPEQAAGAAGAVDERADVYALGAILRFLVTGAAPGEAPAASAGGERGATPKRLAAVWARALEAAPERRYPSVAALAADVTAYLDGGPVAAYRETPVERLGRLAYRHRTPLVLVAAYLLVRLAILAVTGR